VNAPSLVQGKTAQYYQKPGDRRLEQQVQHTWKEATMPRFTIGARVRVAEEKTTDRVGTVVEVLGNAQQGGDYEHYRVEFADGSREVMSDLQLSPAGSGPTLPDQEVA
jgi:hypothetical protein